MNEERNFIKKLKSMGEEKVGDLTNELLSNPKFAAAMGKAIQRAMETKGRFDKNVAVILNAINLPTKADYDRLADKVNSINKNVNALELRIQDLIARSEKAAGGAAKPRKAAAKKKTSPKKKAAPSKAGK